MSEGYTPNTRNNNPGGIILKTAAFGLVLVAGYYLGGGCNDSEIKRISEEYKKHENALVQERIQDCDFQLQYFENKVKDLKSKKSKWERELR